MTDVLGDDTEFSELVDANVPRVDLVSRPANGSAGFLLMKQESQAGLMPPEAIRDLIGKTADPTPQEETVTMTGSPGAIAKLMHEAALRARQRDEVAKEKYDTEDRKRMAANGQAMEDGSYPIADKADLDDAIRAVGRGGADHDAIRRHIIHRAKALGASSEIPENWAADGSLKEVTKMAVTGELDEEVIMAELDATIVLAEPDDDMDAPGNASEPGSPAWEAIDAATARKWTSIAVRLRNALCVMAEREMLEAASADPDDIEAAWDLKDAECALDYVIDTLAGFAVEEQAEAELAAEMEMVGKALHAVDITALDTFEALAPVAKAGRVLSAANEQAIREAADSLQKVLASLPAAPVEKTANEEDTMPKPTSSAETVANQGGEPAMGTAQAEPKAVAGQVVSEVEKADGEGKKAMVVVYDQNKRLIGIVDPDDITPVANSEADADDMEDATDGDSNDGGEAATETPDLEPQPAAEAGTPADTVPNDDEAVTKTTDTTSDTQSSFLELVKSALAEHAATTTAQIATTGDAVVALVGMVETLKGQVKALEEQTAEPRVFTNGAVPPRDQLRGQDRGTASQIDLAKAAELKQELYRGQDAGAQTRAATALNEMAIVKLREITGR
jgi:hypothetical protein